MLYSPNPPVLENSHNIKFYPMSYSYDKLLTQLKTVQLSPWTSNCSEVIDVTPQRKSMHGTDNWEVSQDAQWNFVPPLEWAEEAFRTVKAYRGQSDLITGLHEITRDDLAAVILHYDEEESVRADLFDIGQYFN